MNCHIKYNDNIDKNLYCVYCKELIKLGQKYIIVEEEELDDVVIKEYHIDCCPSEEN